MLDRLAAAYDVYMRAPGATASASAALLPLVAACGNSPSPGPRSGHPGTVHVVQQWVGHGLYTEGSYSYVRVERGDKAVVQARLTGAKTFETTLRLGSGSYRLVSFQRPCDGNRGLLDPPTDTCSRAIEVAADAVVEATVRLSPGEGCTIETGA